jgi:hypothetical protein
VDDRGIAAAAPTIIRSAKVSVLASLAQQCAQLPFSGSWLQ